MSIHVVVITWSMGGGVESEREKYRSLTPGTWHACILGPASHTAHVPYRSYTPKGYSQCSPTPTPTMLCIATVLYLIDNRGVPMVQMDSNIIKKG